MIPRADDSQVLLVFHRTQVAFKLRKLVPGSARQRPKGPAPAPNGGKVTHTLRHGEAIIAPGCVIQDLRIGLRRCMLRIFCLPSALV